MKLSHHPELETIIEKTIVHLEIGGNGKMNGAGKKVKPLKLALTFHQLPLNYDLGALKELPAPAEDADMLAMRTHEKLSAIKLMLDSMEPGQMEFDATKDDPVDYYGAVLDELSVFGFHQKQLEKCIS